VHTRVCKTARWRDGFWSGWRGCVVALLGLGDDPVEQVPEKRPDRGWTSQLPDMSEVIPCPDATRNTRALTRIPV
jgi:hypothetical protein